MSEWQSVASLAEQLGVDPSRIYDRVWCEKRGIEKRSATTEDYLLGIPRSARTVVRLDSPRPNSEPSTQRKSAWVPASKRLTIVVEDAAPGIEAELARVEQERDELLKINGRLRERLAKAMLRQDTTKSVKLRPLKIEVKS